VVGGGWWVRLLTLCFVGCGCFMWREAVLHDSGGGGSSVHPPSTSTEWTRTSTPPSVGAATPAPTTTTTAPTNQMTRSSSHRTIISRQRRVGTSASAPIEGVHPRVARSDPGGSPCKSLGGRALPLWTSGQGRGVQLRDAKKCRPMNAHPRPPRRRWCTGSPSPSLSSRRPLRGGGGGEDPSGRGNSTGFA
jgi:hypothetical protein